MYWKPDYPRVDWDRENLIEDVAISCTFCFPLDSRETVDWQASKDSQDDLHETKECEETRAYAAKRNFTCFSRLRRSLSLSLLHLNTHTFAHANTHTHTHCLLLGDGTVVSSLSNTKRGDETCQWEEVTVHSQMEVGTRAAMDEERKPSIQRTPECSKEHCSAREIVTRQNFKSNYQLRQ